LGTGHPALIKHLNCQAGRDLPIGNNHNTAIRILRYGPHPALFTWFSALILITLFTKRSGFGVLILLLALPLWAWRYYAAKSARRGLLGLLIAIILSLGLMAALFLVIQGTVRNWIPKSFLDSVLSGAIWQAVLQAPLADSAEALLRTFIGWFGWMRVPLPEPLYLLGGAVTLVGALFALVGFTQIFSKRLLGWQRQGLFLLLLLLLAQFALTFGKDIVYGIYAGDYADGSLPQMRYVYPAITAFLLPMLLGFRRVFSERWRRWALPISIVMLLIFNIYILAFVLYPFFWL
jgi:predicted neutral ceramidase superfamily lipid hydrolase